MLCFGGRCFEMRKFHMSAGKKDCAACIKSARCLIPVFVNSSRCCVLHTHLFNSHGKKASLKAFISLFKTSITNDLLPFYIFSLNKNSPSNALFLVPELLLITLLGSACLAPKINLHDGTKDLYLER